MSQWDPIQYPAITYEQTATTKLKLTVDPAKQDNTNFTAVTVDGKDGTSKMPSSSNNAHDTLRSTLESGRPTFRRWTVQLAHIYKRGNKTGGYIGSLFIPYTARPPKDSLWQVYSYDANSRTGELHVRKPLSRDERLVPALEHPCHNEYPLEGFALGNLFGPDTYMKISSTRASMLTPVGSASAKNDASIRFVMLSGRTTKSREPNVEDFEGVATWYELKAGYREHREANPTTQTLGSNDEESKGCCCTVI